MAGLPSPAPRSRAEAGFSLIELAILLTVIAIIVTGLLAWIAPPAIDEAQRLRITKQRMALIEESLINYRATFGRLPCPAKRSLIDTDPKAGEEDCTGVDATVDDAEYGAGKVACRNGGGSLFNAVKKNVGVVPARTLGLGLAMMVDGWGRRFTYHVAEDICPTDPSGTAIACTSSAFSANHGNIEVRSGDSAGGFVAVANPSVTPASGAAYVLISHGQNGNCGWLPSGSQKAAFGMTPGNVTATGIAQGEAENVDQLDGADPIYWMDVYTREFDDIVRFKTRAQTDYAIMDPDTFPMSEQECKDLTRTLNQIGSADAAWLDTSQSGPTYTSTNWPWHNPYSNADAVLRVIWYMQELCVRYYPENYDDDGLDQSGGAYIDVRGCGKSTSTSQARVYNSFSPLGCTCPSGKIWDGTNCN